jgi:tetratricopeptide (TPR) repeat protein
MKKRILIAAAAATAAGTVLLLGGVLRESAPAGASAAGAGLAAEAFETHYSTARGTASTVLRLQSALRASQQDSRSWSLLGLAYQQRARETGDPVFYAKADGVLRHALALEPDDATAVSALASLALSRHRFREALALGRRALRLSPQTARNYGAIGDALVELGRYGEAFRAFDTMARLKPGLSAYARVSYARELIGRRAAAISAMRLAVDSAVGGEPGAWSHVQLGKLYISSGRYGAAAREFRVALGYSPEYAYALDALAQAEAARGRLTKAITAERRAVRATPLPQYVALLGDLYRVTGREHAATRQYALIGAIRRLLEANGVKTDLEIALFQADHAVDLRGALRRARIAQRDRPSIDGNDVLGWTLYRNGRCAEAVPYSERALRLGTQDALKFFHRGMIERCLGNDASGRRWLRRALDLNPGFSILWSPVARRLAR